MSDDPKQIIESLRPLFERARREGLWFRSHYQSIWRTPDELERDQARGKLIWGLPNWELLSPDVLTKQLEKERNSAQMRLDNHLHKLRLLAATEGRHVD